MQNATEGVTYQPDRPHYGCWPQTCHISDACWWEPTVYAGFLLSSLLWWVMGVCSLETQVTDTKTDSQGQDTDPNVFNTKNTENVLRNHTDSRFILFLLLVIVFSLYMSYEHVHPMIQQNHTVLNTACECLCQWLLYLWVGGPPVQSWSWH